MARLIPNENTWIAYVTTIADISVPKVTSELGAGSTKVLTPYVISLNASSRGNVVATPDQSTKFETSIDGTLTATFEMDCYRTDDGTDLAWTTLARGTAGYIVIARWGRAGAAPQNSDTVEVWPIKVVSRAAANMTSNTAQTFTVTCAVTKVPNEAATATTG